MSESKKLNDFEQSTKQSTCIVAHDAVRREPVELRSVIAGLGGRAVTKASLRAVFESACNGTLPDETVFLDLDRTLVEHQLAREAEQRHTGPVAESLNREVNERKILQGEEI